MDYLIPWFTSAHHEKLVEMMQAQIKLEESLNQSDTPWYQQGHDWQTAILQELSEFQNHLGWKWWASSKIDKQQAKFELVDIMCFYLAASAESLLKDLDTETRDEEMQNFCEFLEGVAEDETVKPQNYEHFATNSELVQLSDAVKYCMGGIISEGPTSLPLNFFIFMCEKMLLSFDELHRLFMGKYVLNLFRQAHGYQSGNYKKIWAGQEDNIYLYNFTAKGLSGQDLYDALANAYGKLVLDKESNEIGRKLNAREAELWSEIRSRGAVEISSDIFHPKHQLALILKEKGLVSITLNSDGNSARVEALSQTRH